MSENILNESSSQIKFSDQQKFFGCIVPRGYELSGDGIWFETKPKKETGGSSTIKICSIPVMVTGRFESPEGSNIVEITYNDKGKEGTIYANQSAILGVKEFREQIRPKNLRIDDFELKQMIRFFNACINENENVAGTAFKTGFAFSTTGWKDDDCTKFVAGNRLFHDIDGKLVEEQCIFTDENIAVMFEPRGTRAAWVDAVTPLFEYPRTRFVFYTGMAAIILKYLHVDSFTLDLYGGISGKDNDKSSSGKTTMLTATISGIGNVMPESGNGLFNVCWGTSNFVENLAAKYNDLPIGLDESTNLAKEEREKLAYRMSSRVTKGRASNGTGGIQAAHRKQNVTIVTGENPLIPHNANIGTKVRCPAIEGGIGVAGISVIVSTANDGCLRNSGHILRLFLEEFYKNRESTLDVYLKIKALLEASTDNDMAKRQASYFAAITAAGYVVESVFSRIGIPTKKPYIDIVSFIWNDCVISNPIQAQWRDALDDTWNWFNANKDKYFCPVSKYSQSLWGWTVNVTENGKTNVLLEFNKLELRKFLEEHGYNPDSVYDSWRECGITNVNKPEKRKDGSFGKPPRYKNATRAGASMAVIQMNISKVVEILSLSEDIINIMKSDW